MIAKSRFRFTARAPKRKLGLVLGREPKRPWSGFDYLVLVVLALLTACFVIRPLGLELASVFQRLTDAFRTGR